MEKENLKVVKANVEYAKPKDGSMFNLVYSDGTIPHYGSARVIMELEDGSVFNMEFYHDEINISSGEVLGRTVREAYEVKRKKDIAYLRAGV